MFGKKKKGKKEEEFVKDEPKIPESDKVLYEKEIEAPAEEVPVEVPTQVEETPKQEEEIVTQEKDEEVNKLLQRVEEIKKEQEAIKAKQTEKIIVVREYPTAPVREYVDENGSKVKLITIEEYLTEQANK